MQKNDDTSRGVGTAVGVALLKSVDVSKIRALISRLLQEENVEDLRDGGQLVVQAKDKFMTVLCRVCGWDDWMSESSRSVPDPVVERAVEEIQANPESFMASSE